MSEKDQAWNRVEEPKSGKKKAKERLRAHPAGPFMSGWGEMKEDPTSTYLGEEKEGELTKKKAKGPAT